MIIGALSHRAALVKPAAVFDRSDIEGIRTIEDLVQLEGLPKDTQRVAPILDSSEAMELPAPALQRPVLMVHGLAQKADNWVGLKNFLDNNPANRWGGVFRTSEEGEFTERLRQNPTANMFAIDISDSLASPRAVAGEVRRAITAICRATGASQVDLVTHSMGGLVAREAVRQGENRIGKLAMLAPPSQGAFEANLAVKAFDSGTYQHYPPGRMSAMRDIQLEYGMTGSVLNQWLHDLNEFWKTAPTKPETVVITGVGMPTPDRDTMPGLAQGDAMVAAKRAYLEDEPFYVALPNQLEASDPNFRDFQQFVYNHLAILNAPDVFRQVGEFLTDGSTPPPAPPPRPPVSDFERYLSEVQDRNSSIRLGLVEAEHKRSQARTLQKVGMWTSLGGSLVTLGGLTAVALGQVGWGVGLMATGAVSMGAGTVLQRVHREKETRSDRNSGQLAEEAINLADDLVHRFRTQEP